MMARACCGIEFTSEEELARHQVHQHGAPRAAVGTCCGLEFYTEEGLREHLRVGHGKG